MLKYEAPQQSVAQRDSSLWARNDNHTKSKFNPPPICGLSTTCRRYSIVNNLIIAVGKPKFLACANEHH